MNDPYASMKAFAHFAKRALERHGLLLRLRDVHDLVNQIKIREAEFLTWSYGPGFRSFYRLKIYGDPYIVLYDFELDMLVTIYHNSWLKKKDGRWQHTKKKRKYESKRMD